MLHYSKKPVDVGDVYIDKMVISDPFHFVKKSFFSTIFSRQVFSRLQTTKTMKKLHQHGILLLRMNGYLKHFDDAKVTNFLIPD